MARVYWDYEEVDGEVVRDQPAVRLIPVENVRFDPAADWTDPVQSSPYFIELIAMYVGDIRTRMTRRDPKTGRSEWHEYPDATIRQAMTHIADSTRQARQRGMEDPSDRNQTVQDYEMAWVQRHIHRRDGKDWVFYMLGDICLLSDPVPLKREVFHGERDYVMGSWILETHTTMPASMAELVKPIQDETNEIVNQRLDNVKLVLNKRWFVARGKNVDVASLMRNVPGGATMMDKPKEDIVPIDFQDVTQSSYAEQDRLNADFDELGGNFSANSQGPQGRLAETVGGASLLNAPASMMTGYGLLTFTRTFAEPILKQLIKLEQHYETDMTVLTLAAQKSQMWQRYGQSMALDKMLDASLTVQINMGMGATDPATRLQKLIGGMTAFTNIAKSAPPWMNLKEIGKEFWGCLGYQDGTRFFNGEDPQVLLLQQQLQQAMKFIQQLGLQLKDHTQTNQTKFEIAKLNNETKEKIAGSGHKDPHHEMMLDAHKAALKHELNEKELDHKMEMKAKEFAFEAALKVWEMQQQTLQTQMGMRQGEETHQQSLRQGEQTHGQSLRHGDEMLKSKQKAMTVKPKARANG